MDKKKKILVVVLVLFGLAVAALAYFYGTGDLFQGYLRINTNTSSTTTKPVLRQLDNEFNQTLDRLSTGQRIDSAEDDEAGLIIPGRVVEEEKNPITETIELQFEEFDYEYTPQADDHDAGKATDFNYTIEQTP